MAKNDTLANYLKKKRIAAGMTQTELAGMLKYGSAQFVSNWERGLAEPPMQALSKLVKPLNLDVDWMVQLVLKRTETELKKQFKNYR